MDNLAVDRESTRSDSCIELAHLDVSFGDADGGTGVEASIDFLGRRCKITMSIDELSKGIGSSKGGDGRTSLKTVCT